MIYRLLDNYQLRGWKSASCVLVKKPENQVRFINKTDFGLLLLCDGITELNEEDLSEDQEKKINQFLEEGIIRICEKNNPLKAEQEYFLYENRFVESVFWSVTGRCNFRCRHCYMDGSKGLLGEITHEEAISLIDQMAECGVLRVEITGGEPFVRKDIWELIDRILSHGIVIDQIYTNGWLINEKLLDQFEERNLKPEFSLSFDGVGCHDWMRGVSGAEESTIRAIRLLRKRGFSVDVEMCTHKGNIHSLSKTVELLASLDVRIKCGSVMMTDLWKKNSEGNAFSQEEYIEAMIDYIPEFFRAGMPTRVLLGDIIELKKGSREYRVIPDKYDGTEACLERFMCGAARRAAYISPEGRLMPCMPMTSSIDQDKFPTIQEIGLREGLRDSYYMRFVNGKINELFEANPECNACEFKYRCGGGCRAVALSEEKDLFGCDRGRCILWKKGYVEKIRKAAEDAIRTYCS